MSQSQIGSTWLRLEPPFFLDAALKCSGLDRQGIAVQSFADDEIAAKINVALRASIELNGIEEPPGK